MDPIKIEVAINVNVDMSQSTKDFVTGIVERKIEAAKENLDKSSQPLLSVLSMLVGGCNTVTTGPEHSNPIEKEAHAVAEAEREAIASVEAAVKQQETKPESSQTKPSKEKQESAKTVSIEDVRGVLTTKVNDHREAIRAKLNEFGAKSVTTLDPSKYNEMYEFLKSL